MHSELDLGVGMGWCAEYSYDPALLLRDFLVPGNGLGAGAAKYRRKLAAALKLNGAAQARALGRLDVDVTKDLATTAVLSTYDNRYFFSSTRTPTPTGASRRWR